MSTQSFADFGASRPVVDALAGGGITAAFPVQRLVLPDALAGRDVLVRSPTGSGKTIAFAVPLVERLEATDPRPSALVLAPTRELVRQIVDDIGPLAHAGRSPSRRSTEAPGSSARASWLAEPTSWWPRRDVSRI